MGARMDCGYIGQRRNAFKEYLYITHKQTLLTIYGISFNSVAQLAGVSKKYLYDNHFDRINALREKQSGISPKKVKQNTSDASKDVLLAAKNKKIKELEAEVERLKKIIEKKYAEEYEKL